MNTSNAAMIYDEEYSAQPQQQQQSMNKYKTILIIEDDQILSQTIKRFSEKYFQNILVFECAEKASNYLKNTKLKVDVALIDYFLPGETGAKFAKRIHLKNPECKLYLMSGDLENINNDENLNSFEEILAKPLSLTKIKQIVESEN